MAREPLPTWPAAVPSVVQGRLMVGRPCAVVVACAAVRAEARPIHRACGGGVHAQADRMGVRTAGGADQQPALWVGRVPRRPDRREPEAALREVREGVCGMSNNDRQRLDPLEQVLLRAASFAAWNAERPWQREELMLQGGDA